MRQVSRAVKIATAQGSEAAATTTEVYDRQGRLISVTEPSGSAGANVTTSYGYDVGNRLASVSTTSGSITQTRGFSYDLAGLLKSETHPEKGASGNGTVTYPLYDSRGHVLRKTDGPHDLSFTYDPAERLFRVQEAGSSGRLLKEFLYAGANGADDWRQGRLQQASRYNYETALGASIAVKVDETYVYGGRDGRVSRRDTLVTPTINGTAQAAHAFTQGFTYNDLGLVSSLDYPTCTHAECVQPAPAVFFDVPAGYGARLEIEAIYKAAITDGCLTNPLRYCPEAQLLRSQMAKFLVKAAAGPSYIPPACTGIFADVPCPSPSGNWADWIEDLYHRGITAGCGVSPLRYCPDSNVSNTQMAIFLLRSKEGAGYQPPPCSAPPFLDVSCATTGSAAWIVEAGRRQIAVSCTPGFFCPDTPLTRAQMAVMLTRGFDLPVTTDPNTSRTVQFAYTQGLLTNVAGYVSLLTYYPNLLVSQIAHGNGVTETQGNDPNQMRRPSSLSASGLYANWTSGTYGYDGAGNIKTIGASWYAYDKVNRLVSATLYDGPTGGGTQKQQSYTFDAFGNLTNIAGTVGRMTPTSAQTNRLTGAVTYDAPGNLTSWNGAVYRYDAFNQMTHMTSGAEDWVYLYTADDERLWSYDVPRNSSRWTVRDLGGKVLREYLSDNGRWSAGTDYIYRDGLLLAAETPTGQRHFHLDHLGTPRLITRASGYPASYHVYYPFGEEATAFNQDAERMKFTGHERDLASPTGAGDDLDYMHARHESPVMGRFLSVDSGNGTDGDLKFPQSWNRYTYARDNPLTAIDPDGQEIRIVAYSPAFKASVEGALDHLERATPRLETMVQGLRNSTHVHVIQESSQADNGFNAPASREDGANGKGTNTTTYVGLYMLDTDGNLVTIDEVLAHELSHAEDNDTGTRADRSSCQGCAPDTEVKAVRMQNQLRPDNPRTRYGKMTVPKPKETPKDTRNRRPRSSTTKKRPQ